MSSVHNFELTRKLVAAIHPVPKACYYNAIQALKQAKAGHYIEGHAIDGSGLVLEHAWLDVDGFTVDPTWYSIYSQRHEQSEVEQIMSDISYHSVYSYHYDVLKATGWLKKKSTLVNPLYDNIDFLKKYLGRDDVSNDARQYTRTMRAAEQKLWQRKGNK